MFIKNDPTLIDNYLLIEEKMYELACKFVDDFVNIDIVNKNNKWHVDEVSIEKDCIEIKLIAFGGYGATWYEQWVVPIVLLWTDNWEVEAKKIYDDIVAGRKSRHEDKKAKDAEEALAKRKAEFEKLNKEFNTEESKLNGIR